MIPMAPGTAHGLPAHTPCSLLINNPPTVLERAMMEVTDKSIPAVITTKVCPVARIKRGKRFEKRFFKLVAVAKAGTTGASNKK